MKPALACGPRNPVGNLNDAAEPLAVLGVSGEQLDVYGGLLPNADAAEARVGG